MKITNKNNSYDDFIFTANDTFWNHKPILRYGQVIMNTLNNYWPEKYTEITGSEYDCFYDDTKIDTLLGYLQTNWNLKGEVK